MALIRSSIIELYKKVRPTELKGVVGQPEAVKVLERMIKKKEVPQAIAFTGPSGCGKTTCALILRKHLNCGDADFVEIDGATHRGIDDVKVINSQSRLYAMKAGGNRVWLIDEAHRLTPDAQAALLKTLEFTPKNAYFMFATTDYPKMLTALRGRLYEVKVKLLASKVLEQLISSTLAAEEKDLQADVVEKLIEKAEGSGRRALVLLEQVLHLDNDEEQLALLDDPDAAKQGIDIARALMKPGVKWAEVAKLIKNVTDEPETVRRIVLGYYNSVLLGGGKFAGRAAQVMEAFRDNYFDTGKAGLTLSAWEAVNGR